MVNDEEVFYKICFDSLLEGLCVANYEGRIILNNSAFEDIFGYKKGELVNKKLDVLIPEEYRRNHKNLVKSYFHAPKKFKKGRSREFLGLHKDGTVLDVEIGLNYFNHDGKTYVKALVSDIRHRKQQELRIKQLNKNLEREVENRTNQLTVAIDQLKNSNSQLKDEVKDRILAENLAKQSFEKEKELNSMQVKFVSMASHEFKTPLSGILTSAGLIEKYNQINRNEKIENHSKTIKNLVNQLNAILDDFLHLENVESDQYPIQLSHFDLFDLLKKILDDTKGILKEGQHISVQSDDEELIIYQDRMVIDIIIKNLLYNAIKYSHINDEIRLHLQLKDGLEIHVVDNGIGIPEEALKHIFQRFYRARNALTIQGTGIGLNIVKRHVDRLNGKIEVTSQENQGTQVRIHLPLLTQENGDSTSKALKKRNFNIKNL